MEISWKLRLARPPPTVRSATCRKLQRLLAEKAGLELSSASVSASSTKQPSQIKLSTLIALCTALECTPNHLFYIDTTPVCARLDAAEQKSAQTAAVNDTPAARRGRSMPPL